MASFDSNCGAGGKPDGFPPNGRLRSKCKHLLLSSGAGGRTLVLPLTRKTIRQASSRNISNLFEIFTRLLRRPNLRFSPHLPRSENKIRPFGSILFSGAGGRTRTYEAKIARDLQSLVIATRRLQHLKYPFIITNLARKCNICYNNTSRMTIPPSSCDYSPS